jgi:D-methionine transport system ATP-binding protein
MELTGDQEEINKAIHYIEHRNAEVEVLNNGI